MINDYDYHHDDHDYYYHHDYHHTDYDYHHDDHQNHNLPAPHCPDWVVVRRTDRTWFSSPRESRKKCLEMSRNVLKYLEMSRKKCPANSQQSRQSRADQTQSSGPDNWKE